MQYLYFTYRQVHWNRNSGRYDVSYYNDKQYADFKDSWLTNMIDWARFIPDNRITKETVPWFKTLRKAWVLEFNDALDFEDMKSSLINVAHSFWLEVLTSAEMVAWVKEYTDLVLKEWTTFIINEESEFDWETIPEKLLTIN